MRKPLFLISDDSAVKAALRELEADFENLALSPRDFAQSISDLDSQNAIFLFDLPANLKEARAIANQMQKLFGAPGAKLILLAPADARDLERQFPEAWSVIRKPFLAEDLLTYLYCASETIDLQAAAPAYTPL